MKLSYGWLTTFIIGIAFVVTGCGSTPLPTATTNATNRLIWIEYARYTASQAHEGPTYWVLTKNPVSHVGQFLGAIDDPSTESGWHSNGLSVGTKFFAIPGSRSTKAFAVQMKNGMYFEAVLVGNKKPS